MEHRSAKRYNVQISLLLYLNDKPLGRVITKNISKGGVFILTDAARFKPNTLFELKREEGANHPVRAMLIHAGSDGMGLMLLDGARGWYDTILTDAQMAEAQSETPSTPERTRTTH